MNDGVWRIFILESKAGRERMFRPWPKEGFGYKTQEQKARIGVKRIEHFIKTGK